MSGTSTARRFDSGDKARVFATLAANGGNVKRTSRECDIPPATIRRWRGQWEREGPPPESAVVQAVEDFAAEAEEVRNLALAHLRAQIISGDVKPAQLIVAVGVLTEKITLAKGLPTSKVEHVSALPPREELRELMQASIQDAIAAAGRREDEIIDAEVIEVPTLGPSSIVE